MKCYGFILYKHKNGLENLEREDIFHKISETITIECKPTLLREELKEIQLKNAGVEIYSEEEKKLRKKLKKRIRRLKKKQEKLEELGKDTSEIDGVIKEEELRMKNKDFLYMEINPEEEKIKSSDLFRKVEKPENIQLSMDIHNSNLMKLLKFYQKDYIGIDYLKNQPKVKTNFFKFACHDAVLSKLSEKETDNTNEVGPVNNNTKEENEEGRPLSGFGYHRDIANETKSEQLMKNNDMLFGSGFQINRKSRTEGNNHFKNFYSDIQRDLINGNINSKKHNSLMNKNENIIESQYENYQGGRYNNEIYDSKILHDDVKLPDLEKKRLLDIMEDDLNYIDEEDLDDEIEEIENEIGNSAGKKRDSRGKDIFSLIGGN